MCIFTMRNFFIISAVFLIIGAEEPCRNCIRIEKCEMYGNMTRQEQQKYIEKFSCEGPKDDSMPLYGFGSVAKGDYVCCDITNIQTHEDITDHKDEELDSLRSKHRHKHEEKQIHDPQEIVFIDPDKPKNKNTQPQSQDIQNLDNSGSIPQVNDRSPDFGDYQDYNYNNHQKRQNPSWNAGTNTAGSNYNNNGYSNVNPGYGYNPGYSEQGNGNSRPYQTPNSRNPAYQSNINYPNNRGLVNNPRNTQSSNRGNQGFIKDNPYFMKKTTQNPSLNKPVTQNPLLSSGNSYSGVNGVPSAGRCTLTSFPPAPETGCCGVHASEDERINNYNQNSWMPRVRRAINDTAQVDVTVDNRIAGGKETQLDEYPWTVLLKTTFDYGNKVASFSCGGSIISARYILTAGHCVYEEGASISEVKIYLAEYDKRTFPKDCINVIGEGQKCVENVIMYAEDVIRHPEYDDLRLHNDIALIRLRGNAPYTDYIRPICLPSINIDNPEFSNLRLAVAGWGRNGEYTSDVKQSTVVNLVPQRDCKEHYPHLSTWHLCAAGYTGEDTCKGDSGGPLMMVYEGKYFVAGVVSGKRADSPCGTSVPSLYTNVYQYMDWIRSNIKK